MTRARRLLAVTATIWLSCQIGSAVIVPVAAWVGAVDLADCVCPHGAGAACPMHQKPASGSKVCVMRGLDNQATMVFGSTFGLASPPLTAAVVADPAPVGNLTLPHFSLTLHRPSPPEPPPPRA